MKNLTISVYFISTICHLKMLAEFSKFGPARYWLGPIRGQEHYPVFFFQSSALIEIFTLGKLLEIDPLNHQGRLKGTKTCKCHHLCQ